jgi:hypothetical protein
VAAAIDSDIQAGALAYLLGPTDTRIAVDLGNMGRQPLARVLQGYRLRYPPRFEEVDVRSDSLKKRQEDVEELVTKLTRSISEVDRLRDALDKQLRLGAPASYWRNLGLIRGCGWSCPSLRS